jgi:hypothetical protein
MWLLWVGAEVAGAVGLGSTGAIGVGGDWVDGPFDPAFGGPFGVGGFAPTLDLHANPVLVQIHVLEFTEALIDAEDLYLGANVLFDAHQAPLGGPWLGVVQPGFGIDLLVEDPLALGLTGQCRIGGQVQDGASLGAYVVPTAGLLLNGGDAEWMAGGSLQLSVWFGG